ncbi:lipopolysaccharide biosynthesis protein [Bradymonas sediminis]|uniref:Lipopolysaccharide biosynthesis protein n=1 Tax=Bradymonas sediminis TaxID=1548548 RepID=A0A2Z4FKS8_9DELT|nr:lipopolysaccharide biosynthesis protein [Bradymonas sediminis]AWV89308.1 lipopolysaccharide biosynthesis protein [Bradymonas sediminis]TDP73482.1 PST family polysaccharide transporter [Bradymonas sediminis]
MSHEKQQKHLDTAHLQKGLERRTVQGGVLTAVAQVAISLLNISATLVLARLLLPEDFGLFGMVIVITGFLDMFKDLGLSMATVQREDITHAQVSKLFWINAGISTGLTAITVALAPLVVWFYDDSRLLPITLALASGFLLSGLGIQHKALLKRQMRFMALAIVDFIAVAMSVGLAIWAAWQGLSYWALLVQQLVMAVVGTIGAWVACRWRPSLPRRDTPIGELLKFGGNLTGFSLINHFSRNLDDILIGKVWGATSLGLYQKAYDILMLPLRQINQPVASVAIPMLSRLVGQPERYRRSYLRILDKLLMITMPLGALMIATADWIVLLVLGENWLPAADIFRALGIGMFTQPIGNTTGWLFISQNRTGHMMRWGIVGSVLSMIAFVAGLPWGAYGVALVYSISGLLIRTPIVIWWVCKEGPVKALDIYRSATPFALSAITSGAALWYLRTQWEFEVIGVGLLVATLITVAVSVATLAALPSGRLALRDLKNVVTMLRKKKSAGDDPAA